MGKMSHRLPSAETDTHHHCDRKKIKDGQEFLTRWNRGTEHSVYKSEGKQVFFSYKKWAQEFEVSQVSTESEEQMIYQISY